MRFLTQFLKAGLCGPPQLVPPAGSDPLVPPDFEVYHGSPKIKMLPKVPPDCFLSYLSSYLQKLPFEVYLLKSPFEDTQVTFFSYLLESPFKYTFQKKHLSKLISTVTCFTLPFKFVFKSYFFKLPREVTEVTF